MTTDKRICKTCQTSFLIEPDDFMFYEKMQVPPPEECPECRLEKRILFRNFKTLYKRPSSKSGVSMISMCASDVPFPVYTHEEWWMDDWDAKSYARDYDFSKPFFEQFKALSDVVPRQPSMNLRCQECDYSNSIYDSKRCYLVAGGIDLENCDYGHIVYESRDCLDNVYIRKCELCYECIDCLNCNKLLYSQECENCSDSIGLFDCRSCTNCIGCVGLQQKSHYIYNKPVTKEAYGEFLKKHTIEEIMTEREKLRLSLPSRHMYGSHNNNVSGNHIWKSKNLKYCFDVFSNGEDSKFISISRNLRNCYDISFCPDIEEAYFVMTSIKSSRIYFSHFASASHDVYYSDFVFSSANLFGCTGLKSAEYCILNKQYSKEDYEILKAKIIEHMKSTGEWGKWFPIWMSPFAYNESIVNEYSPLTKEQALAKGYRWKDDIPSTKGQEKDDVDPMKRILKCDQCERNYRFIERELVFYKKMNLPLPTKCFNCRHQRRMNLRLPRKLHPRQCAKCQKDIETSYSPARPEIVYCEQCYQQEVI